MNGKCCVFTAAGSLITNNSHFSVVAELFFLLAEANKLFKKIIMYFLLLSAGQGKVCRTVVKAMDVGYVVVGTRN